ncbi:MAG: hypothetical protein JWQ02_4605 [Capsulimonas sp.]|nr:hypothetical protein [Capsulimonas sp.]
MITIGSITRDAAAGDFPFLAARYPGRRRALKEFTHRDPDFVFWIYPDGKLHDAKDSHLRNTPRGFEYILDDEPDYGGFLRGRVATAFGRQLIVVYCRAEALSAAGPQLDQFLCGIDALPIAIQSDALVVSDNADIYGTITDIFSRGDAKKKARAVLTPSLTIRPAASSHSGEISSLIHEATRWLASRSIAQWETPWPDEWIAWKVEIGEFHCVFEGDVMVGVVRLIWSDTEMWDDNSDPAGYVHTLILRRDFAGRGIGRAVLGWAEEQCRRRGAEYVRLDCRASNPELNRYYVEQGFVACGEKTVDGYCGRLYQKRLVIP